MATQFQDPRTNQIILRKDGRLALKDATVTHIIEKDDETFGQVKAHDIDYALKLLPSGHARRKTWQIIG